MGLRGPQKALNRVASPRATYSPCAPLFHRTVTLPCKVKRSRPDRNEPPSASYGKLVGTIASAIHLTSILTRVVKASKLWNDIPANALWISV